MLIGTALEMELSARDLQVAERRYHLIAEHLQRPTSRLRPYMDQALVYAQGSRAIGATIVDGASDDRFDLDAILEFATPFGWTPRRVLDELCDAFQGFPDVRNIVRCTRCIQLQFAFMHLDITPMDPFREPRQERAGNIYHSPDDKSDARFSVNPYGFAQWFRQHVTMPHPQFADQLRQMRSRMAVPDRIVRGTIMADAEIDRLPPPTNPLRDAPQVIALKLMKRYLNLRYAKRDLKRPVSIYLSKVAVEVPLSSFGLCAQLESYAAELDHRMSLALATGQWPEERNPAFPSENFNDRWPKTNQDMKVFQADLRHLMAELARARQSELTEIQKIFDVLFGERVTEKAVRGYLDTIPEAATASAYERGKGYVTTPALLLPSTSAAAQVSKAPAHHFHTGFLRP
ncbi:nucleotidyltransferase domain-containing protein [Paracoccus lichenicola]|uniref:nucleotidyltransferase domain-containing protein n=1 Tax=Paracoccus lichenicola TaxID=2665644 RepID=UPI001E4C41FE|nr:nucleotidyltransferase [Paracoccus lichenicola]